MAFVEVDEAGEALEVIMEFLYDFTTPRTPPADDIGADVRTDRDNPRNRRTTDSVHLLMADPERAAQLREDPSLIPGAVEEFLRLESPLPAANFRAADESFNIGDAHIRAGDLVAISLQTANRNRAQFPDPASLDPTRGQGQHLAFGHGMHFCLGAPLGRAEGILAIGALLKRFPKLQLAVPSTALTWNQSMFVHRLEALPLLLS